MGATLTQLLKELQRITAQLKKDEPNLIRIGGRVVNRIGSAALEALLETSNTTLSSILSRVNLLLADTTFTAVDFATQTTLASILTRVNLLLADSTFTAIDFASDATLVIIDSVLDNILLDTTSMDSTLLTIDTSLNNIESRIADLLDETTFNLEDFAQESGGNLDDIEAAATSLEGKFDLLGTMGLLIVSIEVTLLLVNSKLSFSGRDIAEILDDIDLNTNAVEDKLDDVRQRLDTKGRYQYRYKRTFTTTGAGTLQVRIQPAASNSLTDIWIGFLGVLGGGRVMTAEIQDVATHSFLKPVTILTVTNLARLGWPHGGASILNMIDGNLVILPGEELEITFTGMLTATPDLMTIVAGASAERSTTAPVVTEGTGTGTFTTSAQVNAITDQGLI